jgi:MFS family permease
VALPALQHDLRASGADAQWVVEAYALFLAALILTGDALGDRLGRRRVYAIGIALFTLASLMGAIASRKATPSRSRIQTATGKHASAYSPANPPPL